MAGHSVVRVCSCQFCDRDDLTPQGHRSHVIWCDGNPHPGLHPDKQAELREMGVLD